MDLVTAIFRSFDAVPQMSGIPWLGMLFWCLFLAGLGLDGLLLAAWWKRRRDGAAGSPFRVSVKPWGFPELGLLIAVICILLLFASLVLSWLERLVILSEQNRDLARLFVGGITFNGCGLVAVGMLLRATGVSIQEAFGVRRRGWGRVLGLSVVSLLAVLPAVWLASGASYTVCSRWNLPTGPQPMVEIFLGAESALIRTGIAVLAVVGAPAFEEVFFRGLIYPLLKERIGWAAALVVTSLMFAAIHFHAPSFAPLFVLAAGLTLAYEVTNNLSVPILMHAAFNLMSILVMVMVAP